MLIEDYDPQTAEAFAKILQESRFPVGNGIIRSLRSLARDIFRTSQKLVPVRTGRLKDSGKQVDTPSGAMVYYDTPYATKVEAGFVQFRRVTKNNANKFLRNANQLPISPNKFKNIRTVTQKSGKPQYFLKNALDQEFDSFPMYLKKYGQEEINKSRSQ